MVFNEGMIFDSSNKNNEKICSIISEKCITYLSPCDKMSNKRKLRRKGFILEDHEGTVHHVKEVMATRA